MKLKKLIIKNIASISEATIDFTAEPLRSAPIFLICGETGSGKTTILDSICLALYNKTPRLSNAKASDDTKYDDNGQMIDIKKVNQLLKKGESSGEVKLSFTGADGNDYLAQWSCRLKPRVHGLDDETWTVTDSSGHTGKAAQQKMEAITGMDFDQFCRTSMLAQGEFTRFLKADAKNKSDILEKITGTEIYANIGKAIYDRYTDARRESLLAEAEVKSAKENLLDHDEIQKIRHDIEAIDAAINTNSSRVSMIEQLAGAYDKIEAASREKEQATEAGTKGKEKFRILTNALAYDSRELERLEGELSRLQENIASQDEVAPMYSSVQTITVNLRNVTKLEGIIAAKENEKKELEILLEKTAAQHKENIAKKDSAAKELEARKKVLADAENVKSGMNPQQVEKTRKDILAWQKAAGNAESELLNIKSEKKYLEAEEQALENLKAEISKDEAVLKNLEDSAAKAEAEFNEEDILYQRQKECTDRFIVELRDRLRSSGAQECPVCHSKINDLPTLEHEQNLLRPVRERWEKKKKASEDARKEVTKTGTVLKTNTETAAGKSKEIEKLKQDLAKKYDCLLKNYRRLGLNEESDPAESLRQFKLRIEKSMAENEAMLEKIRVQDKIISSARKDADDFLKNVYGPADAGATESEKEIIRLLGRVDTCSKTIEEAQKTRNESFSKAAGLILYKDWQEQWRTDGDGFLGRLENEAAGYAQAVKDRDAVRQSIENLSRSISSSEGARANILALNPDFATEETVPEKFAGNTDMEWGALQVSMENCRQKLAETGKTISENKAILDSGFARHPELPQDRHALDIMKSGILDDTKQKSADKGALQAKLDENETRNSMLQEKRSSYQKIKHIFEQWTQLNTMFGGADGAAFKKVAQSYIMQDILNHANGYLKRISSRYELLAQPGSLLILVRDNEDNITRSGNTLSGGESFVISLALALGLSSMAESSISVDTIFIDEGFGTLSHEWLNSVMNALEKLNSTSGKHVGMITHMEELQKKIPTCIIVKKTDATSSTIQII